MVVEVNCNELEPVAANTVQKTYLDNCFSYKSLSRVNKRKVMLTLMKWAYKTDSHYCKQNCKKGEMFEVRALPKM